MEYLQFLIIVAFSPLIQGVIRKLKANFQGRRGPGVLQPYYDLARLFSKQMVISRVASWIFSAAPYIVFVSTVLACMIVPVITTRTPFGVMGDVIALIYILALGRFFMALAGLDAGTAFGGEGSSREMTIAIMAEPMIMLALFTVAITKGSTSVANMALASGALGSPSSVLAFSAFLVAIVTETARVPVDNPDTHLELTMVHEGMLLEYSGRNLALMEWSYCIKQMLLFTIAADIFFPFGLAHGAGAAGIAASAGLYALKMLFMAALMALIESSRAKMRFFQLPSLLGASFVLALLALLIHAMMGQ